MVCLGIEPMAAEWKAQTNPLRYVGTPKPNILSYFYLLTLYVGSENVEHHYSSVSIDTVQIQFGACQKWKS